jgi:hypothetical protein
MEREMGGGVLKVEPPNSLIGQCWVGDAEVLEKHRPAAAP